MDPVIYLSVEKELNYCLDVRLKKLPVERFEPVTIIKHEKCYAHQIKQLKNIFRKSNGTDGSSVRISKKLTPIRHIYYTY